MILDNSNNNPKVHEWITKYTEDGTLSVVTGYFTVSALAYLSRQTNSKIREYKFILGDIVNVDNEHDRSIDLLNEEITVDAALRLNSLAKEAIQFLQLSTLEIKTLEPNFCHAKLFVYRHHDNEVQKNYYISGSSNLTEAGIGLKHTNNIELNIAGFGSEPQYYQLVDWFETLWKRPQAHLNKTIINSDGTKTLVPFKQYLIDEISNICTGYSPRELYYKVLFELFGEELLLEKNNPELNRQIGRLENTAVYNALYEFQQKGALSLIKMLQKFNGAILADAVGLGKTWTALAVIKFYQLQGREVILFCPKKLRDNWRVYLRNQDSAFEQDQFEYFVRFHTDLSESLMNRYTDRNDKFFTNDKPKLFVIDESHNLRNDKSERYKFLVEKILSQNADAKVLMLSATPINNSLMDIRNQFKLVVAGNEKGFEETLDIKNLDYTFRSAQQSFNEWSKKPKSTIGEFIKALPFNFFKLTDSLTVARTRAMVAGHQNGLDFPHKAKPENVWVTPKHIGNMESFEELFKHFPPMLSGYQPSFYVDDEENKNVVHDEKLRDRFLVKMMYILLIKRLESSWFSFALTVDRVLEHHQNALDKIIAYQKEKKETDQNIEELSLFEEEEYGDILDTFTLGKKRITKLKDIDRSGRLDTYKQDLKTDIEALQFLQTNLAAFQKKIDKETAIKTTAAQKLNSGDDKLETLIRIINEKRNKGENNGNPKVLIFTVYKDTAFYLFNQLKARGFEQLAVISGDASKVSDADGETQRFEPFLERFAPFTKLFREKQWAFQPSAQTHSPLKQFEEWKHWIAYNDPNTQKKLEHPIDILIATDVLSEGQNLQDCDFVVNYDIHWNPVRVIQRMGRIDRLGSPNKLIFGVNFWPSENINTYLNLQGRIEQRMAAMKLAGSEVDLKFSESFRAIAEDEALEQRQKDRMLEQMQASWDDIETSTTLGFDDFSLETFRQELLQELREKEHEYRRMPNGIYTGFIPTSHICPEEGIIALLGYPRKPPKADKFRYKGYELIYITMDGNTVLLNQKEILDALAFHKDHVRSVPKALDLGEAQAVERLAAALKTWLKRQTAQETPQADGTTKQTMGKAQLDLLKQLKSGSKAALQQIQEEQPISKRYDADNIDLITWFILSKNV